MAGLRSFAHPSLDRSLKQIRLLEIQSDDPEEPIRCSLNTYNISDAREYIALSYTWGSKFQQRRIKINGAEFFVRQNLFDFLVEARGRLPESLFWIDQICIDQVNFQERNHQVSLMSLIYRDALYVIAWLGAGGDDSDLAIAYLRKRHKEPIWAGLTTSDSGRKWFSGYEPAPSPQVRDGVVALFARPYWNRLWIIQEVVLAREVVLFCGSLELTWPEVEQFVVNLHRAGVTEMISTHVTKLFHINKPIVYSVYEQPTETNARSFLLEPWISHGGWSIESFRTSIYRCCDFECSDPRDKIYGLLGVSRGRERCIEVDYSKSTVSVFWDFFAAHIHGIEHIRDDGTGRPVKLPIEEVLDDWWQYAIRVMSSMGIDKPWLRNEVATLLVKTFEALQRDWLSKGLLEIEEQQDISSFFSKKLQSGHNRESEELKEARAGTQRSDLDFDQDYNSIFDQYVDPTDFSMN